MSSSTSSWRSGPRPLHERPPHARPAEQSRDPHGRRPHDSPASPSPSAISSTRTTVSSSSARSARSRWSESTAATSTGTASNSHAAHHPGSRYGNGWGEPPGNAGTAADDGWGAPLDPKVPPKAEDDDGGWGATDVDANGWNLGVSQAMSKLSVHEGKGVKERSSPSANGRPTQSPRVKQEIQAAPAFQLRHVESGRDSWRNRGGASQPAPASEHAQPPGAVLPAQREIPPHTSGASARASGSGSGSHSIPPATLFNMSAQALPLAPAHTIRTCPPYSHPAAPSLEPDPKSATSTSAFSDHTATSEASHTSRSDPGGLSHGFHRQTNNSNVGRGRGGHGGKGRSGGGRQRRPRQPPIQSQPTIAPREDFVKANREIARACQSAPRDLERAWSRGGNHGERMVKGFDKMFSELTTQIMDVHLEGKLEDSTSDTVLESCAAILALETVPHWDHVGDVQSIRGFLRPEGYWNDWPEDELDGEEELP